MSEQLVNTIARERVEDLAAKNSEPAWLRESRLSAWEAYLQAPMPTARDEEWRKTDIESLDLKAMQAIDLCSRGGIVLNNVPPVFQSIEEYFPARTATVIEVGDAYSSTAISDDLKKAGVVFCTLKDALKDHPDLIREYLGTSLDDSKFVLLNKALFNGGAFLYVPKGVEITEPFVSINHFVTTEAGPNKDLAIFPRVIVVLGENSKANLINVLSSHQNQNKEGAANKTLSFINALVDIHLERGAGLEYLELQSFDTNVFAVVRTKNELSQDAQINSLTIGLGGSQLKGDIVTSLDERGAQSTVNGIVLGDGQEHFNFNTIQRHKAPDTESNINFRVVLKDSSSSVYQGTIEVSKVAQRITAFQSNKNLLLGSKARADSIPRLEILADDVKCSHGATVGPVDREQIFYLMSRGLTATAAEELIVTGFFRQVLESCRIGRAKEWLYELLAEKIHNV